jgi:acetamidase/formamidase
VAALSVLDGDMSQYISDNADDEISHHGKPPGGSRGRRRNVLGTNGGQQVMALLFCGLPGANGSLGNATVHGSNPAGVPGVPGNFGGNMDYAGMNAGAKLMLPVNEPGALLFIGDGHARMGEGEVVGSGLETSMDVEFTVDVVKKKPTAGRASRTTRIQVLSPPTFRS